MKMQNVMLKNLKSKQYKSLIFSLLVLFLSNGALSITAHALPSEDQHKHLWFVCLGIKDKASQKQVEECLNSFSNAIDNVKDLQNQLRNKFGLKVGVDHRLLMHWGFNLNDPRKHRQLCNRIEDQVSSEEERTKIFEFVKEKWHVRNKEMRKSTKETFGLETRANALATIIYDIHILADYTDIRIRPLADLKYLVEKDLIRHGLNKLFRGLKGENDSKLTAEKIKKTLRAAPPKTIDLKRKYQKDIAELFKNRKNISHLLPEQRKALKVLIILKRNLPELLGKSWQNTLSKKGITITYKKSLTEKAYKVFSGLNKLF